MPVYERIDAIVFYKGSIQMNIAVTGITGNMGQAVLTELEKLPEIENIKLLCNSVKRMKKLLKRHKAFKSKLQTVEGGMTAPAIEKLISGVDLVINMAAVIPPRSDHFPQAAVVCNELGAKLLVSAIECSERQPALIHISTVAVYGNRSGAHPFVRVGDPLLASPLDVYSATKIRSEFRVLESSVRKWVILRQSAMLHPQMLAGNVSDPLMYHTTYDAPLEWSTAHDSGVLIRKIVQSFAANDIPEKFWRRCFNIAGGKANREYGMQTFDAGFKIIGGSMRDFFKPGYSATRNFHGGWFLDGDELNDMFPYIQQTTADYWKEIENTHPVFKLGRLVPKGLIRQFLFKRLLKNDNAPAYWAKHNDEARVIAYFGSREKYDRLNNSTWDDITLPDPATIPALTDNAAPVFYGFDFDKPDDKLTTTDLKSVAKAHGGELLSEWRGDMYEKLDWQTQDGKKFTARPYTVLRAGHWHNPLYDGFVWDFDRLSKTDKVFASVWYDTHECDEDFVYSLDGDFKAHVKKTDAESKA